MNEISFTKERDAFQSCGQTTVLPMDVHHEDKRAIKVESEILESARTRVPLKVNGLKIVFAH